MQIKINKTIAGNKVQVELDEKEDKEAIAKMVFWATKDICLHKEGDKRCYSENVIWETNKAKTDDGMFTYIKRRCLKCGATSTMGSYKEGGFFWKAWEIYNPDSNISEDDML